MHSGRFGQSLQIIPAFKQADDPIVAKLARHIHQPRSGPVKIITGQVDLRQWVSVMRVKPG